MNVEKFSVFGLNVEISYLSIKSKLFLKDLHMKGNDSDAVSSVLWDLFYEAFTLPGELLILTSWKSGIPSFLEKMLCFYRELTKHALQWNRFLTFVLTEQEKLNIWASDQDYFGKHGLRRKDGTLHMPQHFLLDIGWSATHACDSPANYIYMCVSVSGTTNCPLNHAVKTLISDPVSMSLWLPLWMLTRHFTLSWVVLFWRREKYFYS